MGTRKEPADKVHGFPEAGNPSSGIKPDRECGGLARARICGKERACPCSHRLQRHEPSRTKALDGKRLNIALYANLVETMRLGIGSPPCPGKLPHAQFAG